MTSYKNLYSLQLKDIPSQPAELSILQADGSYRLVSGIVTAVARMGSDGGFTLFKLGIPAPMKAHGYSQAMPVAK